MEIGSLEGWEHWTDSGCERLALEVAKQKGRQYALLYAHWRKAHSEDEKKYYRACLNGIEHFFEYSFLGAYVDGETVLTAVRQQVDTEMGVVLK